MKIKNLTGRVGTDAVINILTEIIPDLLYCPDLFDHKKAYGGDFYFCHNHIQMISIPLEVSVQYVEDANIIHIGHLSLEGCALGDGEIHTMQPGEFLSRPSHLTVSICSPDCWEQITNLIKALQAGTVEMAKQIYIIGKEACKEPDGKLEAT